MRGCEVCSGYNNHMRRGEENVRSSQTRFRKGGKVKNRLLLVGFLLALICLLGGFSVLPGEQAVIAPAIDVYIITFGGGEGLNTFIKYNISAVPGGMVIDSVFLTAYIWEVGGTWDGDVMFCNVNDQAWTGADSSRYIIDLPLSDSVLQVSGFGTSTGYAQSVDIQNAFLTDYNASRTFCSIKMKDPDDGTFNPMPGSYPVNDADTLGLGNTLMGFHTYFYPSEYVNAPPWLVVNYHATAVEEAPAQVPSLSVNAFPNPFHEKTEIRLSGVWEKKAEAEINIYDLSGRLVRKYEPCDLCAGALFWDGRDGGGKRVASGIYFCRVTMVQDRFLVRLLLVR